MKSHKIVCGPASKSLANKINSYVQDHALSAEFGVYPDGNAYSRVKIEEKCDLIAIVQSTPTDKDLVHLLQLIEACHNYAEELLVFIPYFGYARQNKEYEKDGYIEASGAAAIAKTIKADRVYTINVHDKNVLKFFPCKAIDIDVSPRFYFHFNSLRRGGVVFISPDDGAFELAKNISGVGSCCKVGECDYLEKKRVSDKKVRISKKNVDVKGKNVVLVDDIISTGGTMVEAARFLKSKGAKDIYAACVHGIFVDNAAEKLFAAGVKEIVATNTIENKFGKLSVIDDIIGKIAIRV